MPLLFSEQGGPQLCPENEEIPRPAQLLAKPEAERHMEIVDRELDAFRFA